MSLILYDQALKDRLDAIYDNVIMAPPDDAFKRSNKEGKVKLPLISAYRMSNPPRWEDFNHPEAFRGRYTMRDKDGNYVQTASIPVDITYQIDIWAQERVYADGLFRELTFEFLRNPDLMIELPTLEQPEVFSMRLTDVETSTEYGDFGDRNNIHRYTMTYEVEFARMFMEGDTVKYVKTIPVEFIEVDQYGFTRSRERTEMSAGLEES